MRRNVFSKMLKVLMHLHGWQRVVWTIRVYTVVVLVLPEDTVDVKWKIGEEVKVPLLYLTKNSLRVTQLGLLKCGLISLDPSRCAKN